MWSAQQQTDLESENLSVRVLSLKIQHRKVSGGFCLGESRILSMPDLNPLLSQVPSEELNLHFSGSASMPKTAISVDEGNDFELNFLEVHQVPLMIQVKWKLSI